MTPGGGGAHNDTRARLHDCLLLVLVTTILTGVPMTEANDPVPPTHKNLCLEDDYTNDLPIFIERQTICNFESVPVHVYTIKTSPDSNANKYCLKGRWVGLEARNTHPSPF